MSYLLLLNLFSKIHPFICIMYSSMRIFCHFYSELKMMKCKCCIITDDYFKCNEINNALSCIAAKKNNWKVNWTQMDLF